MENRFEITDEIMEKAQTYMPVMLKETIVGDVARVCVKESRGIRRFDEEQTEEEELLYGLPPVWAENTLNKSRVMMTVLMSYYLNVWDSNASLLCSLDDYDEYAGAHVLNQLERYKSSKYREKVFDLLSDYRDMEKRLNCAVYSVLRELNDPATRIMSALSTLSSPEALDKMMEAVQEAQEGLEAEKERQERIIQGEEGAEADGK